MATEYHSSTHERFEKKVDEEAIENEGKHDKVEDALGQATTTSSKTEGEAEGDEKKSEPQPKIADSVAENLKAEKELIPDSQTISTVTEPAPDDAANSQPEEPPPTESTETDKEKQPKRANISEGSVETIQELSDTTEANPLTESEVEVVKETDPSAETSGKLRDAIEEKTRDTKFDESKATEKAEHVITEKVVEEDGMKESSCTDEIQRISKEVDDVSKDPEQAFNNQEVKTDLKEETENSAPIFIEEKVAANDDKKQQGAHGPAIEEAAVDNEKQGQPETKLEVTETLASKLEEKEEDEKPTKESDATKTPEDLPKETPVKPTQKQSNNIISKVKRSLLKAKKAIIGKSPTTSKTIPSQAKGDIKVK